MKIAALTMVYNERHYLPLWLHHYGTALGRENLYIIDDGSDDGSTIGLGAVKVMRQKKAPLDEAGRAARFSAIQAELLTQYDAVIISDADELVVVDPAVCLSLADYVAQRVPEYATTCGLNVMFDTRGEAPLAPGRPLFRQRRYVRFDRAYCKSLISRVPLKWRAGFHFADREPDPRADLMLFHLRAADPGIALDRLRSFNRIERASSSPMERVSPQFNMTEETYLRSFFVNDEEHHVHATEADGFDAAISRKLAMFAAGEEAALDAEGHSLLVLPQRFADCVTLPPAR